MPLKLRYGTKADVPAELAHLYAEREGAWVLDIADGAVERARLDEMRDTNIGLKKQLADLQARFSGIDPDAVRKLEEEKQRLEEERQLKAGELDKVIEGRIKGLKSDWDKQVAALTSDRESLNARLTAIQIDQGVMTAATRRGLRPTALTDITSRARIVFKLVNGAPRAFEADGQTVRYGRDGVSPMTLEEWVDTQVTEAPHLFESNAGGGAAGNGSGGAAGGGGPQKNPFKRGPEWNVTEQMRLLKADPALAQRLKAAA
jgi:hypothetical protein